jgi:hypothetical protein
VEWWAGPNLDLVFELLGSGQLLEAVLEYVGGLVHGVLLLDDALGEHGDEVPSLLQVALQTPPILVKHVAGFVDLVGECCDVLGICVHHRTRTTAPADA